jgi:hypothetical protein
MPLFSNEAQNVKNRTLRTLTYKYVLKTVKGKAIPLQAWGSHEGSGKLRLPDFKTIGT